MELKIAKLMDFSANKLHAKYTDCNRSKSNIFLSTHQHKKRNHQKMQIVIRLKLARHNPKYIPPSDQAGNYFQVGEMVA